MSDKKQKNTMSLTHGIKREIRNDKLALYSSIILVILFVGVYVTAMFIKKTSYVDVNIMDQYLAPLTNGHLLGTDVGGRDIILMLIISARNSFNIAIAVTFFTLFVGNVLGLTTGYFGGKVDLSLILISEPTRPY